MTKEFVLKPLTIGCDPEIFLRDKATKKFVSAHNLLPGNKREPHPVERGTIQVDGMAAEIGIDPSESRSTFRNRVVHVMEQLRTIIPNHELVFEPICEFSEDVWATTPPEAKELGCDPDYDAYTGEQNPRPNGEVQYRTASGHIHLGWTEGMDINDPGHIEACRMMGRQLDFYVGLPAMYCDNDSRRRKLYGKGGAIRIKPYGVEYRTPSNFWLKHTALMEWIHRSACEAYNALYKGVDLYAKLGEQARNVINMDGNPTESQLGEVIMKVGDTFGIGIQQPPFELWCNEIKGLVPKKEKKSNFYYKTGSGVAAVNFWGGARLNGLILDAAPRNPNRWGDGPEQGA